MRHTGFLLLSFVAAMFSCSSDDEQEQRTDGRKLRQLTIAEVPVTRATLADNISALGAAWEAGDKATYFNVSSLRPNIIDLGTLIAHDDAVTSSFSGSVCCKAGDEVALFYPQQEVPITGTNRGKFIINLNGQDGKLETLAKKFHYVYGVAKVTSVTDNTAYAEINNMKSLLAVCKFTFTDGTNPIPVNTLTISFNAGSNGSTLGYPLSATLTPTEIEDVNSLKLTYPTWDTWDEQKLTITLASETSSGVYVALFPSFDFSDYLHFSVTNSSGTYTGTAKATLYAGKYYPVTLKLNQQQP